MNLPPVVTAAEWQSARDELLVAEKRATRLLDDLAARRRRLPMVRFRSDYVFATGSGVVSLAEMFGDLPQLAVYQFMDNGPDHFCPGCTWFTDGVPAAGIGRLAENGVSWWTVSDMPVDQFARRAADRGWTVPFASSRGTSFAADCGAGGGFLLSLFLRDGDDVHRTYSTTQRGVDRLVFANNILDLAPYGRQQSWEDSPTGWPQHPTYG